MTNEMKSEIIPTFPPSTGYGWRKLLKAHHVWKKTDKMNNDFQNNYLHFYQNLEN